MKICLSCFNDLAGYKTGLPCPGTLNFFHLGEELAKLGHEINLVMPKIEEKVLIRDSNLIEIERLGILSEPSLVKIMSQSIVQSLHIMKKEFDIIHCYKPLINSSLPALVSKTRKIVHMDDYEGYGAQLSGYNVLFTKFISFYEKWGLNKFDGITCVSPFLKKLAEEHTEKEVFMIPNGFDPEMFKLHNLGYKKEHKEQKTLVYVGGLKKSVDTDLVIKVMSKVLKKIDANLLIVGDGPIKKELINLSIKLKVRDSIIFTGLRSHKYISSFLDKADVLLLPFRNNLFNQARFSNKIAEYMASGKPIVTNNVGVIKYLMKNNFNAKVLDDFSLKSFANGIIEILENKRLANKIGRNAKKYAYKNLTWKKIAKQLNGFYEEII